MNESKLCTIQQIEQFLNASAPVEFSKSTDGDESERYANAAYAAALPAPHERLQSASEDAAGGPVAHQPLGWRAIA